MKKLFISYCHNDKPFVMRLIDELQRHRVPIWIDSRELRIGDSLMRKIREGIDQSEYFAVVVSESSVKSEWVQRELDIAMTDEVTTGKIKVLPLVIETVDLPAFLKGKLYADFSKDYYTAFQALLATINMATVVMTSVLDERRSSLDFFFKRSFNRYKMQTLLPTQLNEMLNKVSIEITGGYYSAIKLRRLDFSDLDPCTFPPPNFDIIHFEEVFSDGSTIAAHTVCYSNDQDKSYFNREILEISRQILHIIGPSEDVKTLINNIINDVSVHKSTITDLNKCLKWWD